MQKVEDPVCGMEMIPKRGMDKSEYKGQTYYFCWIGCKERFDESPEKYVQSTANQSHDDNG